MLNNCFLGLLSAQTYACDAIVCSTDASRQAMEKRLAHVGELYGRVWDRPAPRLPRLEIIPWGVDAKRFAPMDQMKARRDLDLPVNCTVILCVGRFRIEDKMDWTPLLLAFDRVRSMVRERPLLVLAGAETSDYGQLVAANAAELGVRDQVRVFFNLPQACLPAMYAACDVFVSPTDSLSESFGLTIVEAMACGRPVVASEWDGYKELIVHGETGFKVRTDWADCLAELDAIAPFLAQEQPHLHAGQSVSVDVAEMANYVAILLNNPELRQEMGSRSRDRVLALYDWPGVVEQWESMWGELAAIARAVRVKEPDQMDYLRPCHFAHFSHYASRIIDDAVLARLTKRGRALLSGKGQLFLHPWAAGFLHPEQIMTSLSALKPAGWIGTGLPVGSLISILGKARGLGRDRALMHIMWLAKYDLISLGPAEEDLSVAEGDRDQARA